MVKYFTEDEWRKINSTLENSVTDQYGLPQRREHSFVVASWNIRHFGAYKDKDGKLSRSAGAFGLIERFCSQCDLIAIQEIKENTSSLYQLKHNLNAQGRKYEVLISDVTGEAPGYDGMEERMGWLYDSERIHRGDLASDLTFDRTAVTKNISQALKASIEAEIPDINDARPSHLSKLIRWIEQTKRLIGAEFKSFVQFIRSPHLVEFVVPGEHGAYEFHCINAHLVSGKSKREREQEFFALLEWLLIDSKKVVQRDRKIFLLMADLNLDFESTVDKRRTGISNYIKSINRKRRLHAMVNFPFLDGNFFTNSREDETFDHIAWIADETKMPEASFNNQAGSLGDDQYDYGMFNFKELFIDAGPGKLSDGTIAYPKFEFDVSDHMPIWVRFPIL